MGFLDALLQSAAKDYAGYAGGRIAGLKDKAAADRQAREDALRQALIDAQIANYQSEAAKRSAPAPRQIKTETAADGTVHRYDLETGEDLGALPFKVRVPPAPADPVATHRANRDYDIHHPLPRTETAAASNGNQEDEARGVALLATAKQAMSPETYTRFTAAYRAARNAGSTLSPGRLANQVWAGIKATDPTITPVRPKAVSAKEAQQEKAMRLVANVMREDEAPATPAPASASGAKGKADRWEELRRQHPGASAEAITAQVNREFGGQ